MIPLFPLLLFLFVVSIVFVEAVTELIVKSVIFLPLREKLSRGEGFLSKILNCGYCASVWVAVLPSLAFSVVLSYYLVGWLGILSFFFLVPVIHRCSNYLHNVNDKHWDKYYDKRYGDG